MEWNEPPQQSATSVQDQPVGEEEFGLFDEELKAAGTAACPPTEAETKANKKATDELAHFQQQIKSPDASQRPEHLPAFYTYNVVNSFNGTAKSLRHLHFGMGEDTSTLTSQVAESSMSTPAAGGQVAQGTTPPTMISRSPIGVFQVTAPVRAVPQSGGGRSPILSPVHVPNRRTRMDGKPAAKKRKNQGQQQERSVQSRIDEIYGNNRNKENNNRKDPPPGGKGQQGIVDLTWSP